MTGDGSNMFKHPTQKHGDDFGMVMTLASFRSDTILQKLNGTKELDLWRHFPMVNLKVHVSTVLESPVGC